MEAVDFARLMTLAELLATLSAARLAFELKATFLLAVSLTLVDFIATLINLSMVLLSSVISGMEELARMFSAKA